MLRVGMPDCTPTVNGLYASPPGDGRSTTFGISIVVNECWFQWVTPGESETDASSALGDKNFLMLRNHGLLTVADNIPDAFLFMHGSRWRAGSSSARRRVGRTLIPIDPRIITGATAQAKQVTRGAGGALAWPALLRRLDRLNPGYRD